MMAVREMKGEDRKGERQLLIEEKRRKRINQLTHKAQWRKINTDLMMMIL